MTKPKKLGSGGSKKREYKKTANIFISDLHTNNTMGLIRPNTNLDDGGTYKLSLFQMALWKAWLDFGEEVRNVDAERKVLHLDGDIGENYAKNYSWQYITKNPATILKMMVYTLEPILEVVDDVLIYRGTPAHVGSSMFLEELLANDLSDVVIPYDKKKHIYSWWKGEGLKIGLHTFDVAHPWTIGRLPHTKPNSTNKLAMMLEYYYSVQLSRSIPDYAIRAHVHQLTDSGLNYKVRAFTLPPWCLKGEYVYTTGLDLNIEEVGGIIIVDNQEPYAIRYQPTKEKREWKVL